jgi:hypothetical protein
MMGCKSAPVDREEVDGGRPAVVTGSEIANNLPCAGRGFGAEEAGTMLHVYRSFVGRIGKL